MTKIRIITEPIYISPIAWGQLAESSDTATWFQTEAAYHFMEQQQTIMKPFVVAVERQTPFTVNVRQEQQLMGVMAGYITKEKGRLKQFFTRRAIVIGGPMLHRDITDDEVKALLKAASEFLFGEAIYIETRNFHSYEKYRHLFEQQGFKYQQHLNFQLDTSSLQTVDDNLGKSRKRDIRTSVRNGVIIVDKPTLQQVEEWYVILENLYKTKIHTPLFPLSFFKNLWQHKDGRLILVEYDGKIVAGTACVAFAGKAMYEWFVCGKDGCVKNIFPSSVATYAGISYAAEHDMPVFDMMGAGKKDEAYGVRDFKAKFGGKEVENGRFLYVSSSLLYEIGKLGVKWLKRKR